MGIAESTDLKAAEPPNQKGETMTYAQQIREVHDPMDSPSARCKDGGAAAVEYIIGPNGAIPVIREWEHGEGTTLAFSQISSCLGAIQIQDNWLVGAHFSAFAHPVTFAEFDISNFDCAMEAAGFNTSTVITYFGNGVSYWEGGLNSGSGSKWWANFERLSNDASEKMWLFELTAANTVTATPLG